MNHISETMVQLRGELVQIDTEREQIVAAIDAIEQRYGPSGWQLPKPIGNGAQSKRSE